MAQITGIIHILARVQITHVLFVGYFRVRFSFFFSGCIVNIAFALLLLGELVIWIKVGIKLIWSEQTQQYIHRKPVNECIRTVFCMSEISQFFLTM